MGLKIIVVAFAVLLLLGTATILSYELSIRGYLGSNSYSTIKEAEEKNPFLGC